MAKNKIVYYGETLIDLTGDTVSDDKVQSGYVYHKPDGTQSVGTFVPASGSAIVVTDEQDEHGGIIKHITAVDLSGDTVTAATLQSGVTAHDAQGQAITGTYTPSTPTVNLQSKTATPTESSQTIIADAGYDGLSDVEVGAISSTYIGSQVPTQAGSTITPTESAQVAVASGTYTTGNVNIGAIPSNYIGSGITVNPTITISGPTVTVPSGYYSQNNTPTIPTAAQATPSISISNTGLITATSVQTAGYVFADTTSDTEQLSTQAATTITPSETAQQAVAAHTYTTGIITVGAIPSDYIGSDITQKSATTYNTSTTDQTIASGQYQAGAQTIKAVTTTNLTAANIASGVSVQVGDSNDSDRIIGVTGTYTNDATLSNNNQMLSGYTAYSNGTKYTGSITSKSAQTYTPTTTNQTISAGQYQSGVQTIAGDANQVGSNILSGKSIFGVAGTVTFVTYYTGSSDPSSSLGNNGDIYFKTGG